MEGKQRDKLWSFAGSAIYLYLHAFETGPQHQAPAIQSNTPGRLEQRLWINLEATPMVCANNPPKGVTCHMG